MKFYKRMNTPNFQRGFTLIELLVVIAIIGMLSSIVFASLNSARMKARDARRISDLGQVQKALSLYYDKYGKHPNEGANVPPSGGPAHTDNFKNMAQQLKDEGFLSLIPVHPTPNGPQNLQYSYYNYADNTLGGLLVTELETPNPSHVGFGASCRITWGSGNTNWCNNNPSQPRADYCLCSPK